MKITLNSTFYLLFFSIMPKEKFQRQKYLGRNVLNFWFQMTKCIRTFSPRIDNNIQLKTRFQHLRVVHEWLSTIYDTSPSYIYYKTRCIVTKSFTPSLRPWRHKCTTHHSNLVEIKMKTQKDLILRKNISKRFFKLIKTTSFVSRFKDPFSYMFFKTNDRKTKLIS